MKAHEKLIEEYIEAHPLSDWHEAYEHTADAAYEKMQDMIAEMIDEARDRWKYERNY